jgi:hypothetical protein
MEDTTLNISLRRRAICARHFSLAHGSISFLDLDFPLPPSNKGAEQNRCNDKPDFSRFSWTPRLAHPNSRLPAPISPRTMGHTHGATVESSNGKSASGSPMSRGHCGKCTSLTSPSVVLRLLLHILHYRAPKLTCSLHRPSLTTRALFTRWVIVGLSTMWLLMQQRGIGGSSREMTFHMYPSQLLLQKVLTACI